MRKGPVIILIIELLIICGMCAFVYIKYDDLFIQEEERLEVSYDRDDFQVPIQVEEEEYTVSGSWNPLSLDCVKRPVGNVSDRLSAYLDEWRDTSDVIITSSNECVGDWYFTYDIGYLLAEEVGIEGDDVTFPVKVVVQIREDGILYAYADKDSVTDGVDEFVGNSMDAIYAFISTYGITKSEANLAVTLLYGGSWSRFILSEFGPLIEEEVSESQMELNYQCALGKIYVWEKNSQKDENNYVEYVMDGEKLVLTKLSKEFDQMMPGIEPPIEMYRME